MTKISLKLDVMKYKYLVLLFPVALFSCTVYYFNEPQPIDSSNIYKMPSKLIGSWYIKDSMDILREDFDSISVGRDYYHLITREQVREAKSNVVSDSTVFIVNNKIYVTVDGEVSGGYAFSMSNDTMVINMVENELVQLGKRAFLRKINY